MPKTETKAPEEQVQDESAGLSMDSLEKTPEKPEQPAKSEKIGKSKTKLSDEEKSRAMGIAATAVCIALLAFFLFSQLFVGSRDASSNPNPDQAEQEPAADQDGQGVQDNADASGGDLVLQAPDSGPDQEQPYDPYNTAPWDYRLETEDGEQAVEDKGGGTEGGMRYILRARDGDGTEMYHIIVPAGYAAYDKGDSVDIAAGDLSVEGNEPLTFRWKNIAEISALLEYGEYDYLERSSAAGYAQYDIRALGYYLFNDGQDGSGGWPVVTAELNRISDDESLSGMADYTEYWIIVGWPSPNNQYLLGRIPADAFYAMQSRLYPNITALAKAMFPACAIPDFPDGWFPEKSVPETVADYGIIPVQDGVPEDGASNANEAPVQDGVQETGSDTGGQTPEQDPVTGSDPSTAYAPGP